MKFVVKIKQWLKPKILNAPSYFFKKTAKNINNPTIGPIILLLGIIALLFATNFKTGTILSGWDNLHPEFNFGLNIKRSIFAVWQEHQGVGLLGGMAHASDLPRQILLWFMSIFLPINALRYIWTFLMLFVGSTGAYFLIKTLTKKSSSNTIPLIGSLFYLLNLATVQMFYVPYEAFSTFFGVLPWLMLTSIKFIENQNMKNAFLVALTFLLSTPAFYVQTFFVVFMIALSIILTPYILSKNIISMVLRVSKLYLIIIFINSFWLLPTAYFTLTSSQTNVNSKINQMATESIFLQNKEFGTIPDTMLLKGFMFNAVDPNQNGEIEYMLKPWREHFSNPLVEGLGIILFLGVLTGFISAIKNKNQTIKGFALLLIFSFIALAIDTPPFSWINNLIRDHIPLLNQIFRFPYTKFATLTSLAYAVLFALGIKIIYIKWKSLISPLDNKIKNILKSAPLTLPIILMTVISIPAFQGHLIYEKEKTIIPQEYNDLFKFFEKQDPNTRIANFPQPNFWGWSFYKWQRPQSPSESLVKEDDTYGYGGSGFLWYGIKQPILDRNFDVWSHKNENYYYEISQALYSKDMTKFEAVLNKYQANWVIVDKNITDTTSNKILFIPELEKMLLTGGFAKKTTTIGNIDVYKINLTNNHKNFISLSENLPQVNKYEWNNYDQAYFDLGNYISADNQQQTTNSQSYPFRSLFSLKTQKEISYDIKENETTFEIETKLPSGLISSEKPITISQPAFIENEKLIPLSLELKYDEGSGVQIIAQVVLPEIFLGDRKHTDNSGQIYGIQLPNISPNQFPLSVSLNGSSFNQISSENSKIGVAILLPNESNTLTITNKQGQQIGELAFPVDALEPNQLAPQNIVLNSSPSDTFKLIVPKITASSASFTPSLKNASDVKDCGNFRGKNFLSRPTENNTLILESTKATACTTFFAPGLAHDQGYVVFVNSKNLKGQSMRFWVENIDQKSVPLDVYLPKENKNNESSFILAPMESFGNSYGFHFYNASIGRDDTINEIERLSVYPLFYDFIKSITITTDQVEKGIAFDLSNLNVSHPNESKYIIENLPITTTQRPRTLILSQAYDEGWKAYVLKDQKSKIKNQIYHALPSIFGTEIKDHVMVNNWANGWVLPQDQKSNIKDQTIAIVYLPQYLQYLGFSLVILTFIGISTLHVIDKRKRF